MQNTLRMIMQLVAATTHGAMAETAEKIIVLAGDLKDPTLAISALTNLASDLNQANRDKPGTVASEERVHAYMLCHMAIGLIHDRNDRKITGLPPYALDAIGALLEEKVQEVSSNQNSYTRRFYTEDCSERSWLAKHHLIDLNTGNGRNYMTLRIRQFSQSAEDTGLIELLCNEVEELLAVALRALLDEAQKQHERSLEYAHKDDFDPFLDSDDLP